MKFLRLFLLAALLAAPAARGADTIVTAVITITNNPSYQTSYAGRTNAIVITMGATNRTLWWTNVIGIADSQFALTNSTAACRTNMLVQINTYLIGRSGGPYVSASYGTNSTTNLNLVAPLNSNLVVSISGIGTTNWASVTYITNSYNSAVSLLTLTNALGAENRTNAANAIINYLGGSDTTNAIPQSHKGFTNFLSLAGQQAASNKVWRASTNYGGASDGVRITNAVSISGSNGVLAAMRFTNGIGGFTNGVYRNGYYSNAVLDEVVLTNATVYGGFAAPGAGAASTAIGGTAAGAESVQIGAGTTADGDYAIHIGAGTGNASGDLSVSVGIDAATTAYATTAYGPGAGASEIYAAAFGAFSVGGHSNSAALGPPDHLGNATSTTATNQIRLGTTRHVVSIPGGIQASNAIITNFFSSYGRVTNWSGAFDGLTVTNLVAPAASVASLTAASVIQTNSRSVGTNCVQGFICYPSYAISTVAVGHNVIDVGSNTFVRLTGSPGAAWVLGGITGSIPDGRPLWVVNETGYDVTVWNEDGIVPTAAQHILTYGGTGTGTNVTTTGNAMLQFMYETAAARWIFTGSSEQNLSASATNALSYFMTNGVLVTAAFTNLNVIYGSNMVIRATNSSGLVDLHISSSGGAADGPGATNGNQFTGSTLSIKNGALLTNVTIYSSSPAETIVALPGLGTNGWQVLATNGVVVTGTDSNATLFASGAAGLTNDHFQVRLTNGTPTFIVRTNGDVVGSNLITTRLGPETGLPFRMWAMTNEVIVTNTSASASLLGSQLGSLTIPANFMQPGMTFQFDFLGKVFTGSAPTSQTNALKFGSVTIATNNFPQVLSLAGDPWACTIIVTVRTIGAAGTVFAQGTIFAPTTAGGATSGRVIRLAAGTATVDTTAAQAVDFTIHENQTTYSLYMQQARCVVTP